MSAAATFADPRTRIYQHRCRHNAIYQSTIT